MHNTLGIITNNQHNVFQRSVIAGIRDAAEKRGYRVVIDSYAEDPTHPGPITLDYNRVSGVLVIANAAPVELLRAIFEANKPISLVSHQVAELSIPAVITDNTQGITELVKHIIERCQRQKLVFIRGVPGQRDSDEREAAFIREMMRYNLPISEAMFIRGDFSAAVAADSVQQLIDSGVEFDAITAADYLMAASAVDVLRANGLAVPEDVSVVGFGDAPEAEAAGLTTVAADVVEQGSRAARQLISQIEGLRITGVTMLSVRLVIRETCGCPTQEHLVL
jgi:DNA-binding LacI/PurR family transcriptional regulator